MNNITRSARLAPEHPALAIAATLVTVSVAVAAFWTSASSLGAIGQSVGIHAAILPISLDGAIICASLAIILQQARGESKAFAYVFLLLWTALSVALNAAHVWETTQSLTAVAAISAAPLGLLASTHLLIQTLVARPVAQAAEPETQPVVITRVAPQPVVLKPSIFDSELNPIQSRVTLTPVTTQAKPVTQPAVTPTEPRRVAQSPKPRLVQSQSATIESAVRLRAEGLSQSAIAAKLGSSQSTIGRLLRAAQQEGIAA